MSSCIAAREVTIRLRDRKKGTTRNETVICPARWKKSRLLAYCRREHPEATVVIAEWREVGEPSNPWRTRMWIVDPAEMVAWPMGPRG